MVDVTDATFEEEVLRRSSEVPVVVDLWAPWCGPCQTLGPIIEQVVEATEGRGGPGQGQRGREPGHLGQLPGAVDPRGLRPAGTARWSTPFIGALPEAAVAEFVGRLDARPVRGRPPGRRRGARRDEEPLRRALELQPDHPGAIAALAGMMIARGDTDEAIALLGRIPETPETRLLLAEARLASQQVDVDGVDVDDLLDGLLDRVRDEPDAHQEFLDLLETLGPDDPRTATYRKALAARLF